MRQQRLLGQKKTKRIEQKVAKEAKGRSRRGVSGWSLFPSGLVLVLVVVLENPDVSPSE
jgi:hypothetical protein